MFVKRKKNLNTTCIKGYINRKLNAKYGYELISEDKSVYQIFIFEKFDFEYKKEYFFLLHLPETSEGVMYIFEILNI